MKPKIATTLVFCSLVLISGCTSIRNEMVNALCEQAIEPSIELMSVIYMYQGVNDHFPDTPSDLKAFVASLDNADDFNSSKYRDMEFTHNDDESLTVSYKQVGGDGTVSFTITPVEISPNQRMDLTQPTRSEAGVSGSNDTKQDGNRSD